jgi:hypothetical protein
VLLVWLILVRWQCKMDRPKLMAVEVRRRPSGSFDCVHRIVRDELRSG